MSVNTWLLCSSFRLIRTAVAASTCERINWESPKLDGQRATYHVCSWCMLISQAVEPVSLLTVVGDALERRVQIGDPLVVDHLKRPMLLDVLRVFARISLVETCCARMA